MEFVARDRAWVEQGLSVRPDFILISIRDTGSPKANIPQVPGLLDVLYLAFDDTEPRPGHKLPDFIKPMTTAQARKIVRFFEKYRTQVGTVLVHCEAGMSRSPAVAAALCRRTGGNDSEFFDFHTPNRYVYRLVLDAKS